MDRKVEIRLVNGKGRGVFAKVDINKGDIILEEQSSIVFRKKDANDKTWQMRFALTIAKKEKDTIDKFKYFHPIGRDSREVKELKDLFERDLREQFLQSLSNIGKKNYEECDKDLFIHILAKIRLNCFDSTNTKYCCLFKNASMFNHSCDYNAEFKVVEENIYILSTKDIKKDEEVTICYSNEFFNTKGKEERKVLIRSMYLFDCNCNFCK